MADLLLPERYRKGQLERKRELDTARLHAKVRTERRIRQFVEDQQMKAVAPAPAADTSNQGDEGDTEDDEDEGDMGA